MSRQCQMPDKAERRVPHAFLKEIEVILDKRAEPYLQKHPPRAFGGALAGGVMGCDFSPLYLAVKIG